MSLYHRMSLKDFSKKNENGQLPEPVTLRHSNTTWMVKLNKKTHISLNQGKRSSKGC